MKLQPAIRHGESGFPRLEVSETAVDTVTGATNSSCGALE